MKKRLIPLWIILVLSWMIYAWNFFQPFKSCPAWYEKMKYTSIWKLVYCENENWEKEWFLYSDDDRGEVIIGQIKDDKTISSIEYSDWYIYKFCENQKCEKYENWNFSFKRWIENLFNGVWWRYWTGIIEEEYEVDEDRIQKWAYKQYENWTLIASWTLDRFYTKTWEWIRYDNSWTMESKRHYSWNKFNGQVTFYYRNWKINTESFYENWHATGVWKRYDKEWNLIDTFDYINVKPLECEKGYKESRDYLDWVLIRQLCKNSSNKRSGKYINFTTDWEIYEVWTYENDQKTWKVIRYQEWWPIYAIGYYSGGESVGELKNYYENGELLAEYKIINWKLDYKSKKLYHYDWTIAQELKDWIYREYYENWKIKTEWAYKNDEMVWTRKSYDEDWKIEEITVYNHWIQEVF